MITKLRLTSQRDRKGTVGLLFFTLIASQKREVLDLQGVIIDHASSDTESRRAHINLEGPIDCPWSGLTRFGLSFRPIVLRGVHLFCYLLGSAFSFLFLTIFAFSFPLFFSSMVIVKN